jgi:hypothetical protein
MKFIRWIAFLALASSAVSFATVYYVRSDSNWTPVQLPMPGAGLAVAEPFLITTAGKFILEVTVPTAFPTKAPAGLSPQPPINCKLRLQIEGPFGLKIERSIVRLEHAGSYEFGGVSMYDSDSLTLPKAGLYTFRLLNEGEIQLLRDHGGEVTLTRFANPTDWYIKFALLRAIAWGLLIIGVIAALISEIRSHRRS